MSETTENNGYRIDDVTVVDAQERYCRSHLAVMNAVSHEGKYLSTDKGFSYGDIISFYKFCLDEGFPQFYVVDDDDRCVGWCDIVARDGQKRTAGYIGLGLLPEYRDRGIGRRLILYAMDRAREAGFTELRLDCRLSNKRAIHLYKSIGFRTTAIRPRGLCVDGRRVPIVCMKLKLRPASDKTGRRALRTEP